MPSMGCLHKMPIPLDFSGAGIYSLRSVNVVFFFTEGQMRLFITCSLPSVMQWDEMLN